MLHHEAQKRTIATVAIALTCLLAGLLAGTLASCSRDGQSAQPARPAAKPVRVLAVAVTTQPIPIQISTFGTVQPSSSIAVKAQVTGILDKVHFQKGQAIKKSQLLFNWEDHQLKS